MRRRRPDEEHENSERWLLTYADLITLLLAFFIMMYTFSKQDAQKYQEVSAHLKAIFSGGSGIAYKASASSGSTLLEVGSKGTQSDEIKKQLEQQIKTLASNNGNNSDNISIFSDERGIVIRIMDKAFFDEGKAELKGGARGALDKIVPIVSHINNHISIEGHTDDVPINTNEFKSNWELSVRRSTEVVRYLIEKGGLLPQRISASGYAEYRPLAENDTPGNRALNRRIEIIVAKSPFEPAIAKTIPE